MMEKPDVQPYRGDFPVTDEEINLNFKYEVSNHFGGEGLLRCLKCGACSGGCPVGSVIDYRPRRVLGKVLLGLKEEVLSGQSIWLCAACFTCEERCVQEVNFTDVITILRNLASKEGHAAQGYLQMAKTVIANGRVSKATTHVGKLREKLGLPPLQEPNMEQLQQIVHASGFIDILQYNKDGELEE